MTNEAMTIVPLPDARVEAIGNGDPATPEECQSLAIETLFARARWRREQYLARKALIREGER